MLPRICGLRLGALLSLYVWRIRRYGPQEVLAGSGISIGVALLFGVLVASTSITGSVGQLLHGLMGSARWIVVARSTEGEPDTLTARIAHLPGVTIAAPILREDATIVGPTGQLPIQLVGLSPTVIGLHAQATQNLGAGAQLLSGGLGLPSSVATSVGAQASKPVALQINGRSKVSNVRAVLGPSVIGPVAGSPIAVALLPVAQSLADRPHRITQVLVATRPGAEQQVYAELKRLANGRMDVRPAEYELDVLRATARPTNQSAALFAAIAAIIGFLLASNAMLLTVPERRRFVAELRAQGFAAKQVILVIISQALFLGLAASLVGIVAGDLLAHTLFHHVPSYLVLAFPVGAAVLVTVRSVALALTFGLAATLIAASPPLLDLRSDRAIDAVLRDTGEPGQRIGPHTVAIAGGLGAIALIGAFALAMLDTQLSIVGGIVLALSAVLLIPPMFAWTLGVLRPITARIRGSMFALAVVELDEAATRSIVLAAVAALATYGNIAIQGARHDLIKGLDNAVVQYLDTADLWITPNNNFLTDDPINTNGLSARLTRVPGVVSVRPYQAALLDVGDRRLWIRARASGDRTPIQTSQILAGDISTATRQIRSGSGWATVSDQFAAQRHLRVHSSFALPTPSGSAAFRVAAITTNVGWPPGAITINSRDYQHYWGTAQPTALEVNLAPGADSQTARAAVSRAIGPGALQVQTLSEREARYEQSARQGVQTLSEIATLLLIASSLAIACALSTTIWQRRTRLAALRAQGFNIRGLWRGLVLECAVLLGVGGLDGALLGLYGHALATRWLRLSTGFPAAFAIDPIQSAIALAILAGVALAVIALPGMAAVNTPPSMSFRD